MQRTNTKGQVKLEFSNVGELYAYAHSPTYYEEDFVGATIPQIYARKYGWEEGVKKIESLPEYSAPASVGARFVRSWSDYDGDELDPERMRDGFPCLSRRVKTAGQRTRGVARVIVNMAELQNVSTESMLWKAYAAARLVDGLETAGQRCEIIAAAYSEAAHINPERSNLCLIKIKAPEEPLNLGLCLNAFSPWMFRYWIFGAREVVGNVPSWTGRSRSIKGRPDTEGAIIIDRGDCLSRYDAEAFIRQNEKAAA